VFGVATWDGIFERETKRKKKVPMGAEGALHRALPGVLVL